MSRRDNSSDGSTSLCYARRRAFWLHGHCDHGLCSSVLRYIMLEAANFYCIDSRVGKYGSYSCFATPSRLINWIETGIKWLSYSRKLLLPNEQDVLLRKEDEFELLLCYYPIVWTLPGYWNLYVLLMIPFFWSGADLWKAILILFTTYSQIVVTLDSSYRCIIEYLMTEVPSSVVSQLCKRRNLLSPPKADSYSFWYSSDAKRRS